MHELNRLLRSNTKFKHLQLLVAVSDCRQIGLAAKVLHLSQPVASKSLAELESMVGAQLFERTPTGLVETAQGSLLVRYARETLAMLDRVADDLAATQLGLASTIHVGTQITASVLVPLGIRLLKERSPHTTVHIEDGVIEPLVEHLSLGKLDMIIVRVESIPDTTGLEVETLYEDAVVAVTAPDAAIASAPALQWSQLADLPWVLPAPGTAARVRYEYGMRQHGLDLPRDLVETASYLPMITLTRVRQGICMLPEALARYSQEAGLVKILPLPALVANSPIGIAKVAGRRQHPGVELFSDCLREAAHAEQR